MRRALAGEGGTTSSHQIPWYGFNQYQWSGSARGSFSQISEGSRIGLLRWNRLGNNIRTSVLHVMNIVWLNIYYTCTYLLGHEVNIFLTVSYSERKEGRREGGREGRQDRWTNTLQKSLQQWIWPRALRVGL